MARARVRSLLVVILRLRGSPGVMGTGCRFGAFEDLGVVGDPPQSASWLAARSFS